MSEQQMGYGYQEEKQSSVVLKWGLNSGITKLTKFEFSANAGKDGAAQEALQIEFTVKGEEKPRKYSLFPITEVFLNNEKKTIAEVKASGSKDWRDAYIKAMNNLSSVVTHILTQYTSKEKVQQLFSQPIPDFKKYCEIAMSAMPKGFENEIMDVFIQYKWNMNINTDEAGNESYVLYTEFPRKMSTGLWLCKHIAPVGKWIEKRIENPDDSEPKALWYEDEAGNVHPFTRNGYYMNKAWAKDKKQRLVEMGEIQDDDSPEQSSSNTTDNSEKNTDW